MRLSFSIVGAVACLMAQAADGPFDRGAVIWLPEDPGPVAAYAAAELRDYVRRVTGTELSVVTNQPFTRGVRFSFVESPSLGEEGFALREKDGVLTISASPKRGVLYGAYDCLERFAGVRWYSADTELVPRRVRIEVPTGFALESKPDFLMRSVHWYDYVNDGDFAARRRNNANSRLTARHGGQPYRFGKGVWACHTLGTLVPAAEFFAEHPEYFGEIDGVRSGYNQRCLTNPDVLRIVTERIKERIRADPGARFYGVSQDDNRQYCRCAKCAAVDEEEGSHAGCVVRFVNAVAAEVEKEFPDAIIETLAYQYSRIPPKKTRLRHNVVPCICSIECCFGPDPIAAGTTEDNRLFAELLRGWGRQTDELYVWDYVTDFADYCHFFPNVNVLQPNLRFFRDNGVRYVFEQGNTQGQHGFLAELKGYLLSKWMWDADLSQDELVRDFTDGYYGKGGVWVRQFLKELDAYYSDYCLRHPGFGASIYERSEAGVYSDDFLRRADELWRKAEQSAAGDPIAVRNVRGGRLSVAYDLFMRHKTPETAAELDDLAREQGDVRWMEGGTLNARCACQIAACRTNKKDWALPGLEMVWQDDFDGEGRPGHLWTVASAGTDKRCVSVSDGCLSLRSGGKSSVSGETNTSLIYGRIDIRAKLPKGPGIKTKIWTLGGGIKTQQWPWCGEIDILEFCSDNPCSWRSGIRWAGAESGRPDHLAEDLVEQTCAEDLTDDFHVFSLTWNKQEIVIALDGTACRRIGLADIRADVRDWPPFNQYHYLMMEVSGGRDSEDRLLVDWVRGYEKAAQQ